MTRDKASTALAELADGNRRFLSGQGRADLSAARRLAVVEVQSPRAVVLGCADSRVPAEIVFDQGFGELFVVRVAGHVVAPSGIGSVEFAAERFGTRLVVILGHTACGAVTATVEAMQAPGKVANRNLASIVDRIRPAVEAAMLAEPDATPDRLLAASIHANIRLQVEALRRGSPIIEALIHDDGLLIVGAEYDLASGSVRFFPG